LRTGDLACVHLSIVDGLAEIRLDNPPNLNALTIGIMSALTAHLDAIDRDSTGACVLLTAEGDRAFCVGADINAWGDLKPAELARHWVRDGDRAGLVGHAALDAFAA
jgi:enoyl-CoA hydratase